MSSIIAFQRPKANQPRAPLTTTLLRRASLLVKGPILVLQFWRMRSELAALARMDSRELADIGLMTTDIANALSSIGPDKTEMLARVAHDRRCRQEA
ncbi:DUF1127 domain-containing protein [Mesorhizobium sp. VK25A]|uniref:DUF1127 domain-containing protein n=1 Tax=Mesorhizobium vachelliae TaxID=3072309 RepID=A0ABU5A1G2_9HYPH|nr:MULTISPECIES: DUF1127 domain-containing protein [unclassified Mesorhizobium]MDX8530098.1 DUF1127 domain-containing protein [Mesorhizobium sp. VK25D]MDX8544496.1 DUF1127 domain-containing protein [Mesorhizobium sp. VK25A]